MHRMTDNRMSKIITQWVPTGKNTRMSKEKSDRVTENCQGVFGYE